MSIDRSGGLPWQAPISFQLFLDVVKYDHGANEIKRIMSVLYVTYNAGIEYSPDPLGCADSRLVSRQPSLSTRYSSGGK
jgi:hypothetical protein